MLQTEKEYIDTMSQLPCDTMLNIKYNTNGKIAWCKYHIPTVRKNGTPVLFGELNQYFTAKDGFLFALGYVSYDDPDGRFYLAKRQYFGFTKNEPPHFNFKDLEHDLVLLKSTGFKQ